MYQLYYSPGTCSMAVHVALLECGAKFELKDASISAGKNREPEFLKLNPRGSVPVLVDDGFVVREGAAILQHILEKENSPLLPKSGNARTAALEWLAFANSTLHPAYGKGFWLKKNGGDEALLKATGEQINKLWEEVDGILAKQQYICGKDITVADILMTVIANWSGNFSNVVLPENCKRLFKDVSSRPAYQKALAAENVTYKAAA